MVFIGRTVCAVCLAAMGLASGMVHAAGPMDFLFEAGSSRAGAGVWKWGEYSAVRLTQAEASAPINEQPVHIETSALVQMLDSIRVDLGGAEPKPLFEAAEARDLANALVKALDKATPAQDVLVATGARREGGALSMQRLVTGRVFVQGGALNVLVAAARSDAPAYHRSSRLVPSLDFGGRAQASGVVLSAEGAKSVRPDWLQLPLSAAPAMARGLSAQPASLSPQRAEPAPVARDAQFYDQQAQRLAGLKSLLDKGLITEQEYASKRQHILEGL